MAFTKAQLEALKNSLLASNQPILASQHRQQIQSIIDEMYDAQSRANILVGVQSDSVQGGSDTFLVFRSGQAYQLPVSLLNANELASLGDVFINNLEDGDSLVYDAVANRWENRSILLGFELSNLTDVQLSSLAGGDILRYNATSSKWENVSLASLLAPYALLTDLDAYQLLSAKGQPNGYASLDGGGKVPANQLPSFVDDVLEFPSLGDFPTTGETGKIYVALDTNKTYRWSGSAYIEISPSDVNSVFGRTGVVTAQAGDYASFYVTLDTDQTITGQKTFNSNLILGASSSLRIIQDVAFSIPPNGTSSIDAITTDFVFAVGLPLTINGVSQRKQFSIQTSLLTNNTNRFYTLPDADGTFLLNASVQVITGNKTFQDSTLRLAGGTALNPFQGTILSNTGATSSATANFNTFGFNNNSNLFFNKGTATNASILAFNNTELRTYTLPDASGTLALTSDLNAYLPLTGGTVASSGSTNTLNIDHASGSGIALNITKGGNGEALTVVKTSGLGLVASFTGGETLISELQTTTKIADQYIASAITWNAKIGGSGTENFIPKFTPNGTSLGNSQIFDNGVNVGIGTTDPKSILNLLKTSSTGAVANIPAIVLTNRDNTNATFVHSGIFADTFRDVANPHYSAGIWFTRTPQISNLSSSSDIVFGTGTQLSPGQLPPERMRIASNGAVTVNNLSGVGTLVWVNSSGTLGRVTVGSGLAFNDANGTLTATGGTAGTVTATPGGTSGFVPRFNSATNLINSQIFDNGVNVGIGTTNPSDKLEIGGAGAGIILASPDGTRYRVTVTDLGVLTVAAV